MQVDEVSLPGLEVAHRLARLRARDQREVQAIERLRSWDGRMSPDSIAASIYQAFTIQLAREFARAAIGDRDLAERWLDRSSSGFTNHVTSPWRWQTRLMDLWAEGDAELVGRSWDELALDSLRAGLDYLADRFGPEPERWRWGRVHRMTFPHPLGEANALFDRIFNRRIETGGSQETVSQIAFDPNDPFNAVWAPSWRMVIDMADPGAARWQSFTGQSGHPGSPHYDDLQPRWLAGKTQRDGRRGPVPGAATEPVEPRMSRRDQIKLSPEEQRELLESERVVHVATMGPRGWPHVMPLWYVIRDGEIWVWTYAKSQKVKNLERDHRATLLIETGEEYQELRGIQIEAEAELIRDSERVLDYGKELTIRYTEGIDSIEGDAAAALEAQAPKRVAIRFHAVRTATWDHRKLGGTY